VGIDETLRGPGFLPVTSTFERAGEVTVDAPVGAPLRSTLDRSQRGQVVNWAPAGTASGPDRSRCPATVVPGARSGHHLGALRPRSCG
jgi:hypothetical protein